MIRAATHVDIPRIIELCRLHVASSCASLTFDEGKVGIMMADLINGGGGIFVAESDGLIVGGIAGEVGEQWASRDLVSDDCRLFVSPVSLVDGDAARLIKRFREWAVSRGAKMVTLGVNTGVHPERTARLMEGVGFKQIGFLYEGIKQ